MAVISTKNAALVYDGNTIGKVINASLDISQGSVENTTVEKTYRTFIPGIKTGTCTVGLLYNPNDTTTVSLINTILTGTMFNLIFFIDSILEKSFTFNAFVTQTTIPLVLRESVAISITMQVTDTITNNL